MRKFDHFVDIEFRFRGDIFVQLPKVWRKRRNFHAIPGWRIQNSRSRSLLRSVDEPIATRIR
jgi:hypothetical protein